MWCRAAGEQKPAGMGWDGSGGAGRFSGMDRPVEAMRGKSGARLPHALAIELLLPKMCWSVGAQANDAARAKRAQY